MCAITVVLPVIMKVLPQLESRGFETVDRRLLRDYDPRRPLWWTQRICAHNRQQARTCRRAKLMPGKTRSHTAVSRRSPTRKYDPEKTKRNILETATKEFAKHGYNGARIDAIAARTAATKRMIYYYFGGKEQLYIAVLEQEYQRIREHEAALELHRLDPERAIRRLAEFT